MPGKQHDLLVTILEAAASEDIGVVLRVSDPVRGRMALYNARATENNPAYASLQFRMWPEDESGGNLIICHEGRRPRAPASNLGDIDLGGVLDLDLDID